MQQDTRWDSGVQPRLKNMNNMYVGTRGDEVEKSREDGNNSRRQGQRAAGKQEDSKH